MVTAFLVLSWVACFVYSFTIMVKAWLLEFDVTVGECMFFAVMSSLWFCSALAATILGFVEGLFTFGLKGFTSRVVFVTKNPRWKS